MSENNIFLELISSCITIILSFLILLFYYTRKINIIEALLFSYACQSFFIIFIGPTISPFFFVTTFLFLGEICYIIIHRSLIFNKYILIIVCLPILSSILIFLLTLSGIDIFGNKSVTYQSIVFNAGYFYIKIFLPTIFVAKRVYRESITLSIEFLFSVIRKVAVISCYIALFQLLVSSITDNIYITRIIGIRPAFLNNYFGSEGAFNATRISAFFNEPKNLSAYLGAAFPVVLMKRKYIQSSLVLIIGVLTIAQTFIIGIIIWGIVFLLMMTIKNVRINIVTGILVLMAFFLVISSFKQTLFKYYVKNSENYFAKLVLARSFDRYDIEDVQESNEVLGLPLQRDMELPVFNFFSERPLLYLSGYGLRNGGFIPPNYYPQHVYDYRVKGYLSYNINMRWFYYITEFGLIIFIVWFILLTRIPKVVTVFEKKYYAFLWLLLFFAEIELLLILVYVFFLIKVYQTRQGLIPAIVNGKNKL